MIAESILWIIISIYLYSLVVANLQMDGTHDVHITSRKYNIHSLVDNRINIGILLPVTDVQLSQEPCFSIRHLLPTAELTINGATRNIYHKPSLIGGIQLWFQDSNCSDTYGPLHAMDLLYDKKVHAFFGPCCKDVLLPVAKYAKVWRTPIITPGGLTPVFSTKKDFPLLTRIMAPYNKLADFILSVFEYHSWSEYCILWHDNLFRRWLGKTECDQISDALVRETRNHRKLHEPYKETFDENFVHSFDWITILGGIQHNSRGNQTI